MAASSGTTLFNPPVSDLVAESYSRLQIRGAGITTEHIIEARRSANIILQDWSGNRSVNLWAVDLITIPLVAGQTTYVLPRNTVQLLDVYIRQYQLACCPGTALGVPLTPMLTAGGIPMVTAYGDPMVVGPGSGTLSSVAGSPVVTVHWPSHGLQPGLPVGFPIEASIGGISLSDLYVVDTIIDIDNFTIIASMPAFATSSLQGGTPLFATTAGSLAVSVDLPSHGLSVGDQFYVSVSTVVGGVTVFGAYTVMTTPNAYTFTITGNVSAATTTAVFENVGVIQIVTQQCGVDPIDRILYPLSRSDYAAIPAKYETGVPSTFWFDRQIIPSITVWQVPEPKSPGNPISYALAMYRMRKIEDADPVSGQTPDMPARFYQAFAAELTASLAEKYAPEVFMQKLQLADKAWMRAATEDSENVPWFITPGLSGYFD